MILAVLQARTSSTRLPGEALRPRRAGDVREATEPFEREHVTPFFYRRPDRFRIVQMTQDRDLADRRWTVDTAEDFAFVEEVYAALFDVDPGFGQGAILALPFERIAA